MAEDRGRISAEEMLNRLLKQEGVSMGGQARQSWRA